MFIVRNTFYRELKQNSELFVNKNSYWILNDVNISLLQA